MRMNRKARLIICLVIFLIMVLLYHVMMDNKSTDVCAMCKNSLDKSYNEVVALIHTHQGEFLNKGNDEFKSFAALFDIKLICVIRVKRFFRSARLILRFLYS